tara:strand:- start:595 stop:846 length:252 start_codon:yes stop_codon:yes gene_type:complete
MEPELIAVAVTSGVAAFAGVIKSLNGFNEKIQRRFNKLQDEIDRVEDDMIRGYVLKQDFIREMDTVHQKLDRILELMIKQNSK